MRLLGRARSEGRGPRHVEIWSELETTSRFLRWVALLSTGWAFLALAGSGYALHIALSRPVAFAIRDDGAATHLGRLAAAGDVTQPEVRYVAKEFLRRHIAVNSMTIESDLAAAANLMTAELQAEHRRMLATYETEHGREFVSYVREQGIQMTLELRDDRMEVKDHGSVFTVRLVGTARTLPLHRIGEESAIVEREIEAHLTLVRCPRTELTPNGLLVSKVASRFYVAEEPGSRPAGMEAEAGASAPVPLEPTHQPDVDPTEVEILPDTAGEGK
jgi:hypothetical protein